MILPSKQFFRILIRLSSTQSECLPVVKLPVYVRKHEKQAKLKEMKHQHSIMKRISYRGNTSIPVILSTDKELNHYLGQLYRDNYPIPLQSKWWYRTNCSGQKFTIKPWDSNPSLPILDKENVAGLFPTEFSELISEANILRQLKECSVEYPTGIQVLTIPEILGEKHVIIASETGSGKTIAYLAPIIQHIISLKRKRTKHFAETPTALILTPGRELAEQIGQVAYNLCRDSKIDVKVLVSEGVLNRKLSAYPYCNVDILVASVGTFKLLFRRGYFKLASLEHLVLDEADTHLDSSFIEDTLYILRHLSVKSPHYHMYTGTKLVLSSSIYPSNLDAIMCEELALEDFSVIKTPYLHRVMPHVKQKFWRVDNPGRAGELLYLVKKDYEKKIPVMIFCNKSTTCDWISLYLEENGVPNVKFHAGLPSMMRSKNFRDFQVGTNNVLCCTDLASRGLDTQRVRHVINFDFPNNVSDYILRAGRVGRVGTNHGYVTSLVVSAPGAATVQEIEMAVRKSARVSYVDSDIRKKIKKLYFSP